MARIRRTVRGERSNELVEEALELTPRLTISSSSRNAFVARARTRRDAPHAAGCCHLQIRSSCRGPYASCAARPKLAHLGPSERPGQRSPIACHLACPALGQGPTASSVTPRRRSMSKLMLPARLPSVNRARVSTRRAVERRSSRCPTAFSAQHRHPYATDTPQRRVTAAETNRAGAATRAPEPGWAHRGPGVGGYSPRRASRQTSSLIRSPANSRRSRLSSSSISGGAKRFPRRSTAPSRLVP